MDDLAETTTNRMGFSCSVEYLPTHEASETTTRRYQLAPCPKHGSGKTKLDGTEDVSATPRALFVTRDKKGGG